MTAKNINAGAPTDIVTHWHNINWAKCRREVRRLQARIVKATQEEKAGKVKALQWLLTHSFSARAMAVKRVTDNRGKRTPGVDGKTWSKPGSKMKAIYTLKRRGYKPLPLRRIYIPKSNGKKRPLGIPTMKDRAMQALYLMALEPVAETTADPNSFGFRPCRSTADAIEQCFTTLHRADRAQWILEADIRSCFDEISHEWLIANIPTDTAILKRWLKAGYIDLGKLYPTSAGTPQGGIISPTLANMVLDGLQPLLKKTFYRSGLNPEKINIIRYADDFVITGISHDTLSEKVLPLLENFLADRGLTLSPEKTRITHISDGFDFLGMNIRKYNGKLLIKPSPQKVKEFLKRVRQTIKDNPTVSQSTLIWHLNPILKGWARYYRHVVSKKIFHKVSHEIWKALWRWACRRHPKKGTGWIRRKYFRSVNFRHWVFGTETGKILPSGKRELLALYEISDMPIKRHRQIKSTANSFDPSYESYFEARLKATMLESIRGYSRLRNLWLRQGGLCPVCRLPVNSTTGWQLRHIVPKSEGGLDNIGNLAMLHPACHHTAKHQGISVMKPALMWSY
ncbi:TPA: group II intron reverse transcriptase/maturase [Escherichia coli]